MTQHLPESDTSAPAPAEFVGEGGARALRHQPPDRVRPDSAHAEPQTKLREAGTAPSWLPDLWPSQRCEVPRL